MDDIVQCPYNPFHMCLKTRLSTHMWKCHNQEYMRDLDLQLQERLHPQEQESWDDDNHSTYVPPVKPWWKKTEKKEEKSGVHPTRFFDLSGHIFFKKLLIAILMKKKNHISHKEHMVMRKLLKKCANFIIYV
jgi:hypothetical protein